MRLLAALPALAALTLVAGCSSLFDLDHPVLVDATRDTSVPDDAPLSDVLADVADDSSIPNACPSSYNITYMTSRYRAITAAVTWAAAAQDCADDLPTTATKHTHLVVLGADAERSQLAAMGLTGGWIGLTDLVNEGTYRWVTQELTSYPPATGAPWAQGEPDNALGQDCVASNTSAQLLDTNCGASVPALCECDDYANDPTRYTP